MRVFPRVQNLALYWLYVLIINNLTTHSDPWKFVASHAVVSPPDKYQRSVIQSEVDEIQNWTVTNPAELNEEKCKEFRIDFSRNSSSIIWSILEYTSPVFHDSLPKYLSNEMERVHTRFLRIISPDMSYAEAIKIRN